MYDIQYIVYGVSLKTPLRVVSTDPNDGSTTWIQMLVQLKLIATYMNCNLFNQVVCVIHAFSFISNTFISNNRLKFALCERQILENIATQWS